ncbi:uncharacterized protein LOC133532403 [Cydia pomonella]|uniref:uncharacterized protein LOC133532403 n=1 Tax=Cydia pomonella TaxID=82600 RepID=UPI002ADE07AD|nr:uncharacterized protein LOC133532403 [Cydia pomonella]
MTPSINLSGNLGQRHRSFNTLVNEAYLQNTPVPDQKLPEESSLERLFNIDLASKNKNVDYIIYTLKDYDMLYVSRALKSLWFLDPEHSKIINASYLEHELFPQMTLPAVNKMRHWIQIHLKDPERCKEFYQYYKDQNFDIAAKFLWHCYNEYILGEFSDILDKITPKLLKRLSEKIPQIMKIYYDNLKNNEKLLKYYLENDSKFFANVKYLLKSDADVFFYIIENFFVHQEFSALNSAISKYIMKHHKNRFLCKPELYTVWFLDTKTVAKYLSSEEIKDLVFKLARAEYLNSWFSYQNVEPLIKRLSKDERTAFKNLVFVDKAFGATVKEWPYPIPTPPKLKTPQTSLFDDAEIRHFDPYYDLEDCLMDCGESLRMPFLNKREYVQWGCKETLLDQLFDKYRFSNYKQTYNDLKKQLRAESSPQNRQFMLLVLVSKTGGRTEDLVSLLDLLLQYKNEPVHIRAAIIRSLVKRAFVWRLPSEYWVRLLEWGHGLGLDGSAHEADCREGLHAVVIRDLLANVKPRQAVWEKFLTDFDTLKEYSFTVEERSRVTTRLPALLLEDAQSQEKPKLKQLRYLLNTLESYNMRYDYFPGTIDAIASSVKWYWNSDDDELRTDTKWLLSQLYDARVARKRLIKEFFEMYQTDESYINALRHDISILENTEEYEKNIDAKNLQHKRFFQKLALFFMEKDGLGKRYCAMLEHRATSEIEKTVAKANAHFSEKSGTKPGRLMLARPLALLSGSTFPSLLETFDAAPPKTTKRRLAAAFRANAHFVRPAFDLESFGWRKAGAKAVANRIATCRKVDVEECLTKTLSWRRTYRLALVLARRVDKERDVFKVYSSERPTKALQAALRYFHYKGDNSDPSVWDMVKSRISEADPRQLGSYLESAESVPEAIKAEYCFLVYLAFKQRVPDLEWNAFLKIPAVLPKLDEKYIYDANDALLEDYFPTKAMDYNKRECRFLYTQTIAKFLVLSTTEDMLEERFSKVGLPLLNRLELLWKKSSRKDPPDQDFIDSFLFYLRYNKAYFNSKYVSCLPVLEKITEWMHGFLPVEKWFEKYVSVHLTMLYFKTVRHCIKEHPELFEEFRKLEGAYMLGTIFGKFIANEIEELNKKYFPTVTEVYAADLEDYFNKHFYSTFDESVEKFTMAVLNGLMTNKSVASCILAKYAFKQIRDRLKSDYVKDIFNKFKESEVKELHFAHYVESQYIDFQISM